MALDDVVEESQATALTTQRAVANTGKVGKAVELQAVEYGYHTDILHATVLYDGIEDNLSVGIQVLQLVPRHSLQELRHREDGACTEPAAHIVARHMILEGIGRDIEDVVLQLLQCRYTIHLLLGLGVTEYEIAKAHVLFNKTTQVHIHLLRILVDEMEVLGFCLVLVDNLRTLQNQWYVLVATPYFAQQFKTSFRVTLFDM